MRQTALKSGDSDRMQLWAGQSAKLARTIPAATLCQELWADTFHLLS
jgi:nitronate monooxygenase